MNNPGFQAGDKKNEGEKAHPRPFKKERKLYEPQNITLIKRTKYQQ
jgi:hypothetical protein